MACGREGEGEGEGGCPAGVGTAVLLSSNDSFGFFCLHLMYRKEIFAGASLDVRRSAASTSNRGTDNENASETRVILPFVPCADSRDVISPNKKPLNTPPGRPWPGPWPFSCLPPPSAPISQQRPFHPGRATPSPPMRLILPPTHHDVSARGHRAGSRH